MDLENISTALEAYIEAHGADLAYLPVIQSQLLELGALVLSAEHYRIKGYEVGVANLIRENFKVKRTSGGWPWNFSWFTAARGAESIEIHTNLPVAGFYGKDRARYVVDIAICKPGVLPLKPTKDPDWSAKNASLVSFIEAKKLIVYPMLLAQFIGIVHEVMPGSLANSPDEKVLGAGHFNPTLVTIGRWARSCERIYLAFPDRGYRIQVIPNLDLTLGQLRHGDMRHSPFDLYRQAKLDPPY
jgi:hypothetical protein